MKTNTLLAVGVFFAYFLTGIYALFLRWLDRYRWNKGIAGWRKLLLWGREMGSIETRVEMFKNIRLKYCTSLQKIKRTVYLYCIVIGLIELFEIAIVKKPQSPESIYYLVIALMGGLVIILFQLLIYWTDIVLRRQHDLKNI